MLQNLRIGQRLGLGFGLLLLLLCVVAGIGAYQTSQINNIVVDISGDWLPSVQTLGELQAEMNDVRRATLRHVLEVTPAGKQAQEARHNDIVTKKIPKTFDAYSKALSSPEEERLFQSIKNAWAAYSVDDNKLLALSAGGEATFSEARQFSTGQSASSFSVLTKAILEDIDLNSKGADAAAQSAAVTYHRVLWVNVISVAIALLVGLALGIKMTRSVTVPIQQAAVLAGAVAEGDLTTRTVPQGRDEAADLLRSLNAMSESLTRIVTQVRASSDSIATGSSQIATGNLNLSQRTEEQASNLQETAASMEQLSSSVKANADAVTTASRMANDACAIAVRGGQSVEAVVATMQDITESSKMIADITNVIDGIAFQTNILALNAAVEAARAGEQGRGFAVVAGEVRTLASRAAEAAREIKSLIGSSVVKIELGAAQVNQAGASMGDIVSQVQRVTQLIGDISSATTEQATGIGQVGDAVSQLDQVTQQNAALVEESAAAAESLRLQAETLIEAVSFFTLTSAIAPEGLPSVS